MERELDTKILAKTASLREEEVIEYREELVKILELFDEIDSYSELIKNLEPLYHPLDEKGILREDRGGEEKPVDIKSLNIEVVEDHVKSSPIK